MSKLLESYFKTVKRFIPDSSAGTSIGLDIGVTNCKLVELSKTGDTYELLTIAEEPIVKGDTKTAVSNILSKCQGDTTSLYTSVFGKGTLIRYIKMPRMSADDLRSSFEVESDKYFPFASDQIYTDCYILDPQGKDKQMSVLATAVRREMINQRVELLKSLELEVNFIGINPIALANVISVLGYSKKEDKVPVVALLDLGGSVSNLSILVDRSPRFTRDIFVGGRDFTMRISNALGISVEEAEALKVDSKDKLEEVINACESTVMNIIEELMLSFDFFSTENNLEIKKLLLTGGGSLLNGISEIFEKHLELKVEQWDPLSLLEASSNVDQGGLKKKSLQYGVALGVALYNYD